MPRLMRCLPVSTLMIGLLAGCARPAAQSEAATTIVADLLADIAQVEEKLTSLGGAIPGDRWPWRPAEGARSVAEVYLHIAADNYLLPTAVGAAAPEATGIKGDDYSTVQAFEAKGLAKDEALAEMARSFVHLRAALQAIPASTMADSVSMFGMSFTRQSFLILTATHLHEHLGQLIAYARSVGVVPPWSQGN